MKSIGLRWEKIKQKRSTTFIKSLPMFSTWFSRNRNRSRTLRKSFSSGWLNAISLKQLRKNKIIKTLLINGTLSMSKNIKNYSSKDKMTFGSAEVQTSSFPSWNKTTFQTESNYWTKLSFWELLTCLVVTVIAKIQYWNHWRKMEIIWCFSASRAW